MKYKIKNHSARIFRMQNNVAFTFLFFILFFLNIGCNEKQESENISQKRKEELASPGRQLAEIHCRSCHMFPEPDLLNRNSWNAVLTGMEREMKKASYQIESEDWFTVQRYYLQYAPASLPPPDKSKKLDERNNVFGDPIEMSSNIEIKPLSTFIKYSEIENVLYTGGMERILYTFNGTTLLDTLKMDNIPICLENNDKESCLDILGVGNLMPSGEKKGQLIRVYENKKQEIIIDSLERPIHFLRHDLDGDGIEEYLVACFGATTDEVNTGKLSLFYLENGQYKEQVIKELPGAMKSVIGDYNNDGRPDVVAMFSQGKEIVSMFYNKGNLEFEEKQLLEFPPVYGSNDFELADVNQDSYVDIIFTNGDNGDNSPVFKNYHGLRIFYNDGSNNFTQKYFYQINGASKILVRDFDVDGDIDIVVLAMYPNLAAFPQEAIVHFENRQKKGFKASFVEGEASSRWVVMDAGDIDSDGDDDLILGANTFIQSILLPPKINEKWTSNKIGYSVFFNKIIN